MKPTSARQRAMTAAYSRAKSRLVQEFSERFRELYLEECASVGITPGPAVPSAHSGAEARWANVDDRTEALAPARKAFADRFEKMVDPDGKLDPAERATRAAVAKSEHFRAMAHRPRKGVRPERRLPGEGR